MLLKLLEVTVQVRVTRLKSNFLGFAPKDSAWKTEFLAYVISRKRSADQQKELQNDTFHVTKAFNYLQ